MSAGKQAVAIESVTIAKDVAIVDGAYTALSEDCWLRIAFRDGLPCGRWIRLRYAGSFLDHLVRPVVRFFMGERHYDEILPGPLLGRAVWLGRMPPDATDMWISPTNRPGPFQFSLEDITLIPDAEIILRCARGSPLGFLKAGAADLIGLRHGAYREFRRALSAQSEDYEEWRRARERRFDPQGMDAPRYPWRDGPHVRFVACRGGKDVAALRGLMSQLRAQPYPHWSLVVASSLADESFGLAGETDARAIVLSPETAAGEALSGLSDADLIVSIAPTDQVPDYALATLADVSRQHAEVTVFYGDQACLACEGGTRSLILRPDWSPIFYAASAYMAGGEFIRVGALRPGLNALRLRDLPAASETVARLAADKGLAVRHIRRVMIERRAADSPRRPPERPKPRVASPISPSTRPLATIIIPTRDRIDLLAACIDGLKNCTLAQHLEVIVVDNGSRRKKSRRFFVQLLQDKRFRIIERPGPFNFSQLCNDGAHEAQADTLVFLNNDTEAIDKNWLKPLLQWTRQSEIGAVGAKLLYPNGRLQHAEVVLGLDGLAGHFERTLDKDDPGYFGRLCVPHEVSAVTAACLAVDKGKFYAVGGFDAVNLPVDLNDIDLCLRLSERGWKTICVPDSVLIHRESASRGKKMRAEEIYQRERAYFRTRWMHRLRDDPFFHPALSLDQHDAALA